LSTYPTEGASSPAGGDELRQSTTQLREQPLLCGGDGVTGQRKAAQGAAFGYVTVHECPERRA